MLAFNYGAGHNNYNDNILSLTMCIHNIFEELKFRGL